MNLVEKVHHPKLFGALPAFQNLKTWAMWMVFIKATFGLPLDNIELEAFKKFTGRTKYAPPEGGFPEVVCITGVQSGKSTIAGVLLGDGALTGEPGTVAVGVAQDIRGSMRVLLRYAREPFEKLPLFQAEVARDTADLMELKRGTALGAYPCRPPALRGVRASIVVLDEPAFYITTDGRPTDTEMWRVARGRVAMTGGKIVAISSPYAQSGLLWDLHRKHFGNDDSPTLIWQASASAMNPLLSADYLQRMEQDDPEAYRSEVLGEFRAGITTFFDSDALAACVDSGVRERLPQPGVQYEAAADSASGSGKDSFAVNIVHRDGDRFVMDLAWAWRPPFNPGGVIAEISTVLKTYRLRGLRGDKYAPGFVLEHFRSQGITYQFADKDQSSLYLELQPIVNAGQVRVLDHPDLLRELRGLERRRGPSGRDHVDHRSGSHDDLAASCAGAVVAANAPVMEPCRMIKIVEGGDPNVERDPMHAWAWF
jgi:hypothetical protein